ncbi:hypothetical protein Tco_0824097 [Tanacetum coccineum]|uniref:Integrase, catalytic region, zinc finger, CCHC-type, peptidase aspartic, catalytic n=1 Tax=Tanacetum coccineum TaxID=301880 RepID=A0ABQ5AP62_9ASTR
MANLSEDIQSASSDTRPLMLDRSDFASWQQRIRLYCLGKDNRENILQSIDEGPFKMGKFRETLVEGAEGALHLCRILVIYNTKEQYRNLKRESRWEDGSSERKTSLRSSTKHNLLSSSCDLLPSCDLVTSGPTCSYYSSC